MTQSIDQKTAQLHRVSSGSSCHRNDFSYSIDNPDGGIEGTNSVGLLSSFVPGWDSSACCRFGDDTLCIPHLNDSNKSWGLMRNQHDFLIIAGIY